MSLPHQMPTMAIKRPTTPTTPFIPSNQDFKNKVYMLAYLVATHHKLTAPDAIDLVKDLVV